MKLAAHARMVASFRLWAVEWCVFCRLSFSGRSLETDLKV